jgi:secretion/DNA translocation related TadE-like protein
VSFLVGALATKHRAGAAADLAALAAAVAMRAGADPCGAATAIASRNGASLAECAEQNGSVTVKVHAPAPSLLGRTIEIPGIARAGWASPH